MDFWLLLISLVLPLLRFVFFPIKTVGRGGNWTLMGAAMIVVAMMGLFLMVRDLGGSGPAPQDSVPAPAHAQGPRLDDLVKTF